MNKKLALLLILGLLIGFFLAVTLQNTRNLPKTNEIDQEPSKEKTEIVKYVQTFVPDISKEGSCWTTSIAAPSNDKAWRCSSGNSIYDPCFDIGNNKVVCPHDPEDKSDDITLDLTSTLPLEAKTETSEGIHAMVYKLEGDVKCYPHTGTAPTFEGVNYFYYCDNDAFMVGDEKDAIAKDTNLWSTTLVYMDKENNIIERMTLPIITIWW